MIFVVPVTKSGTILIWYRYDPAKKDGMNFKYENMQCYEKNCQWCHFFERYLLIFNCQLLFLTTLTKSLSTKKKDTQYRLK